MNIKMDSETGVLYLRIKGSEGTSGLVDQTVEVEEGVYLDLDAEMKPVSPLHGGYVLLRKGARNYALIGSASGR